MKDLRRLMVTAVACLLLGLSLVVPAIAQGLKVMIVSLDAVTNFPEITGTITVLDQNNVPIPDLTLADFEASEDGQPLALTRVTAERDLQQPVSIMLGLDLSRSMPLDDIKDAVYAMVAQLQPDDKLAVVGFNARIDFNNPDPFKEKDFTTQREDILDLVRGLKLGDQSAVYEGIYRCLMLTAKHKAERRAVIVVTDGYDTDSRPEIASAEKPKQYARDNRLAVFTVGLYKEGFRSNPDYLRVLADETGGHYQEAKDPSQLRAIFQSVVDQLRLRYQVTMSSARPADGQTHTLALRVSTAQGQETAQIQVSYPAPPPTPTPEPTTAPSPTPLSSLTAAAQVAITVPAAAGPLTAPPGMAAFYLTELRPELVLSGTVRLVPGLPDDAPVARVEYQVAGQPAGVANSPPWAWDWNTLQLGSGSYTLTVTAYDVNNHPVPLFSDQVQINNGLVVDLRLVLGGTAGVLLILFVILLWVSRSSRRATEPQPEAEEPAPLFRSGRPAAGPDVSGEPFTARSAQSVVEGEYVSGVTDTVRIEQPAGWSPLVPTAAEPATEVLQRKPMPMGWLIIQEGPRAGREFRLGETATIGRTGENDVVLDDSSVSRHHAKIKLEDDKFILFDLGATNTTKVNGQEIARHELVDGDRVQIGRVVLVFKKIETGSDES